MSGIVGDMMGLAGGLAQKIGGMFGVAPAQTNAPPPPPPAMAAYTQGSSAGQFTSPFAQGAPGGYVSPFMQGAPGGFTGPFDLGWRGPMTPAVPSTSSGKNGTSQSTTNTGTQNLSYTPGTGMTPGVAKWAAQTHQVFGDIQGLDPDTMLAIMTNESGGDPNAYNSAGDAWGLFQNVGLHSTDPNAQFAAAHQLAQEKMASINQAYAANGLNPDARTRARDFALAWAGHFDYSTGQPNPNSRDVGSGQTAEQLSGIFLGNYDRIKQGQQQATTAPQQAGAGLANITPGVGGQIMQEFGPTDYAQAHQSTYHYGTAYGLGEGNHPGVDWAVPMGTRVATPLGGTVSVVGNDHGSGYYYTSPMGNSGADTSGEFQVTLDNGDQLILGHMSNITAQVGQRVSAGQLIGQSGGSDGAHVHVEYRQRQADGSYRIIDPRTGIAQWGQQQPTTY
jgi:murein DD-endopeptidase MepM/ murein hydrolase activator NlpD